MKELTFDEVLRIAGGVPVASALDEMHYRSPEETPRDPIAGARPASPFHCPSETE